MDDILTGIPALADTSLLIDALCDADSNTNGSMGNLRSQVFIAPSGALIYEGFIGN